MNQADEWERDPEDPAERLLNLTLALITSSYGMTKAELFVAIRDYRNHLQDGGTVDSLNRKFERDKQDLLKSGIKLETLILTSDMDDNQETRYIIEPSGFRWPDDVKLSAKQLQLLQLAASTWRQASLSSDAAKGLDRLRAFGTSTPSSDIIAFAPRIKTHSRAFAPLTQAVTEHLEVTFSYRRPDQDEAETRTLHPWRISHIEDQWLVQGFDVVRGEARNFLLKRIVSEVKVSKDAVFAPPTQDQIDQHQRELDAHIANNVAILNVKKGSSAWFHYDMSASDQSDVQQLRIQYMDLALLADDLRDYAGDFEVVEPKQLDDAIRSGFEKVVAAHE
jgi:proteasome accessory factor B